MRHTRRASGIIAITLATTTGLTACGFGGGTDEGDGGEGTTLDLLVPNRIVRSLFQRIYES